MLPYLISRLKFNYYYKHFHKMNCRGMLCKVKSNLGRAMLKCTI